MRVEALEERCLLSAVFDLPHVKSGNEIEWEATAPEPNWGWFTTAVETPVDVGSVDNLGWDPNGDAVSLSGDFIVDGGVVNVSDDGQIQFAPASGFEGIASISFYVTDGTSISSWPGTYEVVVGNTVPEAANWTAWIGIDEPLVLGTIYDLGWDVDGDVVQLVDTVTAEHGVVTTDADGFLIYTPDSGYTGSDQLTFAVTDGVHDNVAGIIGVEVGTVCVCYEFPPESVSNGSVEVVEDPFVYYTLDMVTRGAMTGSPRAASNTAGPAEPESPQPTAANYWLPTTLGVPLANNSLIAWHSASILRRDAVGTL